MEGTRLLRLHTKDCEKLGGSKLGIITHISGLSAIWSFLQLGHGLQFLPHKNPLSLFWTLYIILPVSVFFAEILKSFSSSRKWFSSFSLPVLATTFCKKWSTVCPPQGLILVFSTYSWISMYAGITFSSVHWAVSFLLPALDDLTPAPHPIFVAWAPLLFTKDPDSHASPLLITLVFSILHIYVFSSV